MATVDAMKVANKEMKKQYGKINIDKIEVRHLLILDTDDADDALRHGRPD